VGTDLFLPRIISSSAEQDGGPALKRAAGLACIERELSPMSRIASSEVNKTWA
jgi:hypothetical protein